MLSGIIENVFDVIILVLFFGASIFIHELGHFLVAIKLGLVVDAFSIGFGPAIWKKKINGIDFKIGYIPLGGYVALPQLDPSGMATVQGTNENGENVTQRELPEISPIKKIAVAVAGAAGNIVLAVVFACIIWLSPAAITYKGSATINSVKKESPAYAAGLRPGDEILAVNGKKVSTWNDVNVELLLAGGSDSIKLLVASGKDEHTVDAPVKMHEGAKIAVIDGIVRQSTPCILKRILPDSSAEAAGLQENDIVKSLDGIPVTDASSFIELVAERGGKQVPIVVERNGKELTLTVEPKYNEEEKRALIGVWPTDLIFPWMQEKLPLAQLKADASGIMRLLKALVTPKESRQAAEGLGGPVMIIAALWMAIKISIFNAIGFLRFLNVNLAILNLLPIPVLDGGHIVFALWELVTRRKVHAKVVNILVNVFAIILIAVFLLLTFRDVPTVKRLFGHPANTTTNSVERASAPPSINKK
jgi:regulator of sigma E protease